MPVCRDPEALRELLLREEPGTRSIFNLVFGIAGARAKWIRVDDARNPQAVVARDRGTYLYAANPRAADRLVREMPKGAGSVFAATPLRFVRTVRRVRRVRWTEPCRMYILEPGKLVVDRKRRVGTLRAEDVPLVTRYWPYGKSRIYVAARIEVGPTCAIRRSGRLVAWALTHRDGTMGMLHVLKEYRGLGLARSITTALAQRCLKVGIKPFLYIVRGNRASISLTESMGFTYYGDYAWFGW